ncbi:MAG TPA: hypothetical protein VGY55_10350 [Pirellulales bacterium]|nr:hypothetical protein [Pirellulales bacterium]
MNKIMLLFACGTFVMQLARGGPAVADDNPTPAAGDRSTDRSTTASPDPSALKSVMKRRTADDTGQSGNESPPMVSVPRAPIVDPAVRQASGFTTNPPATNAAATDARTAAETNANGPAQAAAAAAADLIAQGLTAPKDSALAGRPTTLLELFARAGNDRNRQSWVVRDYWKLSAAEVDYNWAADELARLELIEAAKGLEASELSAARAAAEARMHEARLGVATAQQELADLFGIAGNTQLPLTADPPLVGPYRTYFDTLFASRVPPPRTRAIDRGLPIRLEAIQARTAALHAASSAVHYAEESRGKGQADLQTLLNCHADLARQRRALLATVRDYNLDIGEYALAVADPAIGTDRLVAMMILVKAPTTLTATGRNEPTLAPPSDDALFKTAVPPQSADNAASRGVRRTGGTGDQRGK